jgi:hypothetical protein
MDQSALSSDTLVPNIMLRSKIATMRVRCKNTGGCSSGRCSWVGPLEQLQAHVGGPCTRQLVRCGVAGCSETFAREHTDAHVAKCAHVPLWCAVDGCGARCTRGTLAEHMRAAGAAHVALLQGCVAELTASNSVSWGAIKLSLLTYFLASCAMNP